MEPPYVDARPVRRHIRWLTRQGVGLKQIAKASGISHGALSKLVYGTTQRAPSKRVRPATAEAVLAVTPAHGADGSKIPAGPTLEIVEQLVAKGWTRAAIAQAIGQNTPALQLGRHYVTRRHAKAIKALLDQPVPPRRSRWGTHPQPDPGPGDPAPAVTSKGIDADRFVLQVVEILEDRIDHRAWHAEAACRDRPPWMWFPAVDDTATVTAAKKVCAACLVRQRCLDVHLEDTDGIYGGHTPDERQHIRADRNVA